MLGPVICFLRTLKANLSKLCSRRSSSSQPQRKVSSSLVAWLNGTLPSHACSGRENCPISMALNMWRVGLGYRRYASELATEMPEVDAVIGFENYGDISKSIERIVTQVGCCRSNCLSCAPDGWPRADASLVSLSPTTERVCNA